MRKVKFMSMLALTACVIFISCEQTVVDPVRISDPATGAESFISPELTDYFAQKADVEGYNDVASVFRSTAEGETGHAHGHLEYLEEVGDPATGKPIGETKANLASAVAGETHEYTDMYPGMAKTARDEGFDEIADWFETLAKAEKSHAGKFQKTLESIK